MPGNHQVITGSLLAGVGRAWIVGSGFQKSACFPQDPNTSSVLMLMPIGTFFSFTTRRSQCPLMACNKIEGSCSHCLAMKNHLVLRWKRSTWLSAA